MHADIPADLQPAVLKLSIRHPHIGKNIKEMWGTALFMEYLDSLLYDKRPGRQGFQRYVLTTLMRLHVTHEALYPALVKKGPAQPEPAQPVAGEVSFDDWD